MAEILIMCTHLLGSTLQISKRLLWKVGGFENFGLLCDNEQWRATIPAEFTGSFLLTLFKCILYSLVADAYEGIIYCLTYSPHCIVTRNSPSTHIPFFPSKIEAFHWKSVNKKGAWRLPQIASIWGCVFYALGFGPGFLRGQGAPRFN